MSTCSHAGRLSSVICPPVGETDRPCSTTGAADMREHPVPAHHHDRDPRNAPRSRTQESVFPPLAFVGPLVAWDMRGID